jgi:hypothetical protein
MDTADHLLGKEGSTVWPGRETRRVAGKHNVCRASGHAAKAGDRFWGLITGAPSRTGSDARARSPLTVRRSGTFLRASSVHMAMSSRPSRTDERPSASDTAQTICSAQRRSACPRRGAYGPSKKRRRPSRDQASGTKAPAVVWGAQTRFHAARLYSWNESAEAVAALDVFRRWWPHDPELPGGRIGRCEVQ